MDDLTDDGRAKVAEVAAHHGISSDAVTHVLRAVAAGNGTQAQFNHPELGGMGQWAQGGMTMVGDMFNTALKARVDSLCSELSDVVRSRDVFAAPSAAKSPHGPSHGSQSQSQGGAASGASLFVQNGGRWPSELGQPASVGTQNDMRYAYFPDVQRLAIDLGGKKTIYDTADHRIGGFGQAQGGGQSLTFTSQHGTMRLSDLRIVAGDTGADDSADPAPKDALPSQVPAAPEPEASGAAPGTDASAQEPATQAESMSDDQIFARIERLADLHAKGILSQSEYDTKKAELLARL